MEAAPKSYKLHPLGNLDLSKPIKAKYRHYKHITRLSALNAKHSDLSVALVRQFLKHFSELSIVHFDSSLLARFKNQLKSIRLLRVIKLDSDNLLSSRHYKKIFRWCPSVTSLSMKIPYETVPCLRLTRKVQTLDISIPGKPFDKSRIDYLRNYLSKLLLLQNLVVDLPKVSMMEILTFLNKTPNLRSLGLQGVELELPKKNEEFEKGNLAKIERLKFGAFTMAHFAFLAQNTSAFQNLKLLESSKSNHLATMVGKKEDIPHFEKLRYLEALTVMKLNLRINTMKYENMLLLLESITFPVALEKMHMTLAIQDIEKEEGLDESLATMINKLSDSKSLTSLNIQLKVKGDFPSLKSLFPRLNPGFTSLKAVNFSIMPTLGEYQHKIELDKIFSWLAKLPNLDYLVLYVPLRELSGFKSLKFPENGFSKLTRFNVMTMQMDVHNTEGSRYFLEYISQMKSIASMHLNSWEQGFSKEDQENLLKYLSNLQNLRELILSINGDKKDLELMAELADLMKFIPKLHIFNLFLRTQPLEDLLDEVLMKKFEPYLEEGRKPKLFVNQVPIF